jgi:hypothetical protein
MVCPRQSLSLPKEVSQIHCRAALNERKRVDNLKHAALDNFSIRARVETQRDQEHSICGINGDCERSLHHFSGLSLAQPIERGAAFSAAVSFVPLCFCV